MPVMRAMRGNAAQPGLIVRVVLRGQVARTTGVTTHAEKGHGELDEPLLRLAGEVLTRRARGLLRQLREGVTLPRCRRRSSRS